MKLQLVLFLSVVSVGLAWNQPSTCYTRQSTCSCDSELREIRESLASIQGTLQTLLGKASHLLIILYEIVLLHSIATQEVTTSPPIEMTTTVRPQEPMTSSPIEPTTPILPLVGSFDNPASSCSEITQDRPSGDYWIRTNITDSSFQVYCDTNRTSCSCNTAGTWMRVANLDMTDSNQNCPSRFRLEERTEPPLRTCGSFGGGCLSFAYSSYGVEFSRVCGRVIGYQFGSTDAFFVTRRTIDMDYVDGVSLTHGQSPRQHIWTFAGALDETETHFISNKCPCIVDTYDGEIPSFVGQDYFCDTGNGQAYTGSADFYPNDPLWDGAGCEGSSTCCQFNNPPWFCKQLPEPTTDDIELRICTDESLIMEHILVEQVEIFVQ